MDIIEKQVYIRSNLSGVWLGTLIEHASDFSWVILTEAEHIYQWQTNEGLTVAALAYAGINRSQSKIDKPVPLAVVRDVIEIIPVVCDVAR
jgi:hypothetical protein